MRSGLHVTQKGSYPVTVGGVGFSTAEINLSKEDIHFHGINIPDLVVITSKEGLNHSKRRIGLMKKKERYSLIRRLMYPIPEQKL